jgi:hypothetical protein
MTAFDVLTRERSEPTTLPTRPVATAPRRSQHPTGRGQRPEPGHRHHPTGRVAAGRSPR